MSEEWRDRRLARVSDHSQLLAAQEVVTEQLEQRIAKLEQRLSDDAKERAQWKRQLFSTVGAFAIAIAVFALGRCAR